MIVTVKTTGYVDIEVSDDCKDVVSEAVSKFLRIDIGDLYQVDGIEIAYTKNGKHVKEVL